MQPNPAPEARAARPTGDHVYDPEAIKREAAAAAS